MRAVIKRNRSRISLREKRGYDPTENFLDVALSKNLISAQVPLDGS